MPPLITSIADYYREINRDFLNKAWREGPEIGFELFYKTGGGNEEPLFLKFGDYAPETRAKIQNLMESKENQSLYIHENDLIKYYNEFQIVNLRQVLENEGPSAKVLSNAYQVCIRLLKEYFDSIGSTRILRSLDEVIEIMRICLTEGKVDTVAVFETTSKENSHSVHCANAGLYNMYFGVQLKLQPTEIRELGLGGMLFDIGKKGIPQNIIEKPGGLTPEEWKHIRKHPSASKKVLNDMHCYSKNILNMAAEHHEKFDGTGYPFGLPGRKISFQAQVCNISDIFSALVCKRYFHEPRSAFEALVEMKNNMPGHFDPKILMSFIQAFARPKD